jgi:alpha-tubulin suppressor-like RCC1 family protein
MAATGPAQTGPGGLVFFGKQAIRESVNSSAPIAEIALGDHHLVAVRADGTVVAWGYNGYNDCEIPGPITNAIHVAAGQDHALILMSDGTIAGFGYNYYTQATPPANLPPAKGIAAGKNLSIALLQDGTVSAWGQESEHSLDVPAGLSGVVQVAAGDLHGLALKSNGTVVGWGSNDNGETSIPSTVVNAKFVAAGGHNSGAVLANGTCVFWGVGWQNSGPPPGLSGVVKLSLAQDNGIALKSDGTIVAWGLYAGVDMIPANAINLQQTATCAGSALALTNDGHVIGWGDSTYGVTVAPERLTNLVSMAAGQNHISFLRGDGSVSSWGDNSQGQCNFPTGSNLKFTMLSAGYNHTAAFGPGMTAGQGLWGGNSDGQTTVPSTLGAIDSLWAAGNTTYAHLKNGGFFKAWGLNQDGELGLQTQLSNALQFVGGSEVVFALKTNGTVVGVGVNDKGQQMIPSGLANVTQISSNGNAVLARKSDGTIAGWGDDNYQQSENIGNLTNVLQVASGWEHSAALMADGTVYAWGANYDGQSPAPPGLAGMAQIVAGSYFTVCMPSVAMNIVPYQIITPGSGTGTVYIPKAAPAAGVTVQLNSSSSAVTLNGGMPFKIPAGATSATFSVQANSISAPTQVFITATLGTSSQTTMITVAPPSLALTTNISQVVGGSTTQLTGNIVLATPAPANGVDIQVLSSDPSLVPQSPVHINGGKVSPANPFTITTKAVAASTKVTLSATYLNQTLNTKVTVQPFTIQSFSLSPTAVLASTPALGTITLNAAPASPINVSFASSNTTLMSSPGVVPISSQTQNLSFPTKVSTTTAPITVTATLNGVNTTASINLYKTISQVTFDSGTWYGNGTTTCTIYLGSAAPAGGYTVNVVGDNVCTPVKSQITIAAGKTASDPFTVVATDVSAKTLATLEVNTGSLWVGASKYVYPNTIGTLVVSPSTFKAGITTRIAITATLLAPVANDVYITVNSDHADLVSALTQIKIPAGSATGSANIKHVTTISKSTNVTLSATRLGVTKQAVVTIMP